jgi:hypothetical protein
MNGNSMNSKLEFEGRINSMSDRDLLEFNARQLFDMCDQTAKHEKRITRIESQDRKIASIAGAIGGTITGCIAALINFFTIKPN